MSLTPIRYDVPYSDQAAEFTEDARWMTGRDDVFKSKLLVTVWSLLQSGSIHRTECTCKKGERDIISFISPAVF